MIPIAKRASSIQPSMIRQFRDAASPSSIDLGLGQTDLPLSKAVHEAVENQLRLGRAPYTPNLGLPELRYAVGVHYGVTPEHVMITCGVQEALAVSLLGLIEEGDEVLCPDPGFPAYPNLVRMAGGVPKSYDLEFGAWQFDPDKIASQITPRTRAIVLNAPGNPTGQVFERERLAALMELCETRNITWISDDIYEDYLYDDITLHHPANFASQAPGIRLSGLSKSHHMMGWRLGWMIAEPTLIESLKPFHQHLVTCASTLSQHAAIASLDVHDEVMSKAIEIFSRRRHVALSWAKSAGFGEPVAQGAFYLFLNLAHLLRPGETSLQFATALLQQQDVVLIPGSGFGARGEGWVRLAYTVDVPILLEAFERIDSFLAQR